MLAVAGLVLAWPPLSDEIASTKPSFLLLMGFIIILLTIATIDARDNLKHSVVRFYMSQAQLIEIELLDLANRAASHSFHVARRWDEWFTAKHRWLIGLFQILVYAIVIVIPAITLYVKASVRYMGVYLGISVAVGIVMFLSVLVLRKKVQWEPGAP